MSNFPLEFVRSLQVEDERERREGGRKVGMERGREGRINGSSFQKSCEKIPRRRLARTPSVRQSCRRAFTGPGVTPALRMRAWLDARTQRSVAVGRSVGKRGMICGASARGREGKPLLPPSLPAGLGLFDTNICVMGGNFLSIRSSSPSVIIMPRAASCRQRTNHFFLFSSAERPNIREALARSGGTLSLLKS